MARRARRIATKRATSRSAPPHTCPAPATLSLHRDGLRATATPSPASPSRSASRPGRFLTAARSLVAAHERERPGHRRDRLPTRRDRPAASRRTINTDRHPGDQRGWDAGRHHLAGPPSPPRRTRPAPSRPRRRAPRRRPPRPTATPPPRPRHRTATATPDGHPGPAPRPRPRRVTPPAGVQCASPVGLTLNRAFIIPGIPVTASPSRRPAGALVEISGLQPPEHHVLPALVRRRSRPAAPARSPSTCCPAPTRVCSPRVSRRPAASRRQRSSTSGRP